MDHDGVEAGSSACAVCGGAVPVTAGRGRRREYCGRGCQSKAYRRRQREEQAAKLARAGKPGGRPIVVDDDEVPATPAGQLLELAETVTVVMRVFLADLEEGQEPDAALVGLRGRLPGLVAKAGALAGQIAHDHRIAAVPGEDAAEGGDVGGDAATARAESAQEMLQAHATALRLYDLAGMPYLRTATPEVTDEAVEPVMPVRELGVPDQLLPLEAPGLEPGWTLAGWHRDPTVFWVLGPDRFRARVEQVGRRWVTVHPMGYLREHRGSGPLVWSGSAQEAALGAARWWQELEAPVRDVFTERFARR